MKEVFEKLNTFNKLLKCEINIKENLAEKAEQCNSTCKHPTSLPLSLAHKLRIQHNYVSKIKICSKFYVALNESLIKYTQFFKM